MNIVLLIVILGLLLITLLGLAVVFHKTRNAHLMLYEIQDQITQKLGDLYSQVEALISLYYGLKLEHGLPSTRGWAASPDFLVQIAEHVRRHNPKVLVECGSGASTIVLSRCLQLNGNGHLYSLEHIPEIATETRQQLAKHGLSEWATVVDPPLQPVQLDGSEWNWYATSEIPEGNIDMVVIDGPPAVEEPLARYPAGPILFGRLNPGAAVFVDDALREGEKESIRRWKEKFPSLRSESRDCEKGCTVLWCNDRL